MKDILKEKLSDVNALEIAKTFREKGNKIENTSKKNTAGFEKVTKRSEEN